MGKKKIELTEEALSVIREMYADTKTSVIAEKLGLNIYFVYRTANGLGLKKSEAFKQSTDSGRLNNFSAKGLNFRFKPGQVPVNKGKKQTEFMSAEAIEKTKGTRFKKGIKPHNVMKDNDIVIRHTSKKRGGKAYKWIRLSAKNWEMLHVHNWKKKHGDIPEGMIITFKNGDQMNCDIENLEMISLAENMKRNTIHRFPEEVKETIRLISKINKKIQKHGNQEQN